MADHPELKEASAERKKMVQAELEKQLRDFNRENNVQFFTWPTAGVDGEYLRFTNARWSRSLVSF